MKKYIVGFLATSMALVSLAPVASAQSFDLQAMKTQVVMILQQVQLLPSDTIADLQLKISLLTSALGLQTQVNKLIAQGQGQVLNQSSLTTLRKMLTEQLRTENSDPYSKLGALLDSDITFKLEPVDVNSDGTMEYLATNVQIQGVYMGGANASESKVMYQNQSGTWKKIGTIDGNEYIVLDAKTGGYKDIKISQSDSATTATETTYKWDSASGQYKATEYKHIQY